jgi:hypothetical protein
LARWRIKLEDYDYEIKYKPGMQNSNVNALSRMYNITEIRNDNYSSFLEKMKTQLISNKNVKETIGNLFDVPVDYHLVSEIAKQYNFTEGINKILKQRFGINKMLTPSKIIGDIKYYKIPGV